MQTIIVRFPNWLGDCVMAVPAWRLVRDAFPDARLVAAGRGSVLDCLAALPGVDGLLTAARGGAAALLGQVFLRHPLEYRCMDGRVAAVDKSAATVFFTNSFSSAFEFWRLGVGRRIGYSRDGRGILLTHPVACDQQTKSLHMINYYLEIAKEATRLLGGDPGAVVPGESVDGLALPTLCPQSNSVAEAADLLSRAGVGKRYAVLAPASAYGPVKDWPISHYARVIGELVDRHDLDVVLTGGKQQFGICAGAVGGQKRVFNLAGATRLGTFLGLLANAGLFLGGDSGGAHVAAALGVPTVVIFGVTDPARTRPVGRRVEIIGSGRINMRLSCNAAKSEAARELASIHPERVLDVVAKVL